MFHRFHQRFGTAGLLIAVIALIAALGGTALAASGALTSKQKKEVKAIAKSFQGTGPAGAAGANGTNGKDGAPGAKGANGANGKSVTVTAIPTEEPKCNELGGAMVEQEGAVSGTEVCNGQTGFTSTLPSGKTETGSWSISTAGASPIVLTPVSFNIPLAKALDKEHVKYITGSSTTECPGSKTEPKAASGYLCVYKGFSTFTFKGIDLNDGSGTEGANTAGAVLSFESSGFGFAMGAFAVTAK
jgi:hypothetical protein